MLSVGRLHGGASESGGKGWRAIAKHYIIGISVNVPFFVLRIRKADGEMEMVGDTQAPHIATLADTATSEMKCKMTSQGTTQEKASFLCEKP